MTLCECGCGQQTPVASKTDTSTGRVAGRPMRFIGGHNARDGARTRREITEADFAIEDRGYDTPCWIGKWVPTGNNGYGRVRFGGVKIMAHRAMYEQTLGPIPDDMVLDHLCRVPLCIRPDHLEPVTHLENVRRGKKGMLA
jgi:hypothetical protein